ncbi:hypothetical protein ACTXT7_001910 [Hymenolepis weldensis]
MATRAGSWLEINAISTFDLCPLFLNAPEKSSTGTFLACLTALIPSPAHFFTLASPPDFFLLATAPTFLLSNRNSCFRHASFHLPNKLQFCISFFFLHSHLSFTFLSHLNLSNDYQ